MKWTIQFLLRFAMGPAAFICTSGFLFSQNFKVINTSPTNQAVAVYAEGEISLMFNEALDTSTISLDNFRVFGRWSGPAKGSIHFTSDHETAFFIPSEKFFAGEWVTVQLAGSAMSSFGEKLEGGYYFGFWIETAPGSLHQEKVGEIEMKMAGEDWIQVYGAYAGDMNNDAFSDLVVVNEASDDLRVLLNDGEGFYQDFTLFDTGDEKRPSPNEGADFNKDGEIDLVVTTAWDNEIRVLFGDGTGGFSSVDVYSSGNGARGVGVADFNADGWDDIIVTNRLSADMTFLWNEGNGVFSIEEYDLPGIDETACAVTDIDNNGTVDVFIAGYNSKNVLVLLNDGKGNFSLSGAQSVLGRPWMIVSGDVNGDGNADVVSVNSDGNNLSVILGDGAGGLSTPEYYSFVNLKFPLAVDLGDLDGDGDLDLVTSNYQSSNYSVFENNGWGGFVLQESLIAPGAASCAILHDRDNDGDLDITTTDEEADVVLLFENPGGINSTEQTSFSYTNVSLQLVSNPALSESLCFKVHLQEGSEISFGVINLEGKILLEWPAQYYTEGSHQLELNLGEALPGGAIFLTAWVDGKIVGSVPVVLK